MPQLRPSLVVPSILCSCNMLCFINVFCHLLASENKYPAAVNCTLPLPLRMEYDLEKSI